MAGAVAEHRRVPMITEFRQNRSMPETRAFPAETAQLTWSQRVSLSATGYYRTPDTGCRNHDRQSVLLFHLWRVDFRSCDRWALTGESRVLATDILQDVGASLNPAIDLRQIEGAFVQGMGCLRRRNSFGTTRVG